MSEQTTPARTHLCLGDRIRDNDPRMERRVLTITRFEADKVVASQAWGNRTGETRISLSRIHLDGKPRRSGWSLL